MQIGRKREVREFEPKVIPIELPKPQPKEDPIPAPNWPQPATVPAEPQKADAG